MRVIFSMFGSIGEVMPFIGVAEALRAQGHKILFICNKSYEALIRAQGFEHVAAWDRPDSMSDLDTVLRTNPLQAWSAVQREMIEASEEPTFLAIEHYVRQEPCVLLASGTAPGAIRAHQRLDVPLCLSYLSPYAVNLEKLSGLGARKEGLRLAAFFPAWFASPTKEWPADLSFAGFPFPDDSLIPPLPEKLARFLDDGARPVIFTPGSFMRNSRMFFDEAMKACQEANWRAIFLTPYAENIPSALPASICHYPYINLQRLAPQAAALACHGGIGTIAQGMRAGIPQLISPVFFDQFDNANELQRLGVGDTLEARNWEALDIIRKLSALLQSASILQNCSDIRGRLNNDSSVSRICSLVQSLIQSYEQPVHP